MAAANKLKHENVTQALQSLSEKNAFSAEICSAGALLTAWLCLRVQGRSWIVKRSYEDFRVLDKHLHLCIYDRRFSQLAELPRSDALKDSPEVTGPPGHPGLSLHPATGVCSGNGLQGRFSWISGTVSS